MPPVTAEVLTENPDILLGLKGYTGQPITCGYEGKVGAVIHGGEYFILSPNMDYIPEPAVNARMSFKYDSRLGDDDPLLWPQPYMKAASFFPCIPKPHNGQPHAETHAILHKTYCSDYFVPILTGTLSGLGTLRPDIVEQLAASLKLCKTLHQQNEDDPKCVKTELGAQYITSLQIGIRHFGKLPMSSKQQKFVFAQHQRAMLEFIAMIRFISTFWDRMNSPVADRKIVDAPEDVVGAFFFDPTAADLYWKAGIPVWLVCPAYKAGALRIDRLVDTIKGRDVLVVEDDPMDHRGVYYSGSPHSSEKYKFFVEYSRRYLSGSNPFIVTETRCYFGDLEEKPTESIASMSASATIPSASGASTSAIGAVRSDRSKAPKVAQPYVTPISKAHRGPSQTPIFADITGPLAPPAIDSWRTALAAIDTVPINRISSFTSANNGYAFPPPSLFINVQTEARRALFFTNWLQHRTALIFRISAPRTQASPIANQMWRTLLGWQREASVEVGPAPRETKSAQRKRVIEDILSSCINATEGISLNAIDNNTISWQGNELVANTAPAPEIARQILWELSELNFRCELVGLDKRSHRDPLFVKPPAALSPDIPLPAPVTREDLLQNCFVGKSPLDIQIGHANQGLASPLWTDRREYLVALHNVIVTWVGFQSYATSKNFRDLLKPTARSSDITESETCRLEALVTGFYTQSFFNFFGRAPVLPRRL